MARRGRDNLRTAHGVLRLPAFLPDATRAVVRSLDAADLGAVGVQGVVASLFHLANHPGTGAVAAAGGLHQFMGWQRPLLTDSGGFQVYSLLVGASRLGSVRKAGFRYRMEPGAPSKTLSPETCIRKQLRMRPDIVVCLDHCTHPSAPAAVQEQSVENTIRWARLCRETFDRLTAGPESRPLLFAVVQGGSDAALRRQCTEALVAIGFDGYCFGGWPVDEAGRLQESVAAVAELLPPEAPKWALGIGKPEHVVAGAAMGYDLFDCVLPTRDARHNRLYVFRGDPQRVSLTGRDFYEHLHVHDKKHIRDAEPIDPHCDCPCCRRYSRAYLHHLFHVRDGLAYRLATLHNLRFYARLMERLRVGARGA